MYYTIDRFEGEFAVLEDENRKMSNIKRIDIPENAKEGDILIKQKESFLVDRGETERRKIEIAEKVKRLFK